MSDLLASTQQRQLPSLPPLSLYVHIPWCIRKCPYCDFNSHAASAQLPEQEYIRALLYDLQQELAFLEQPRKLQSVFIGGGTPSLFSAAAMQQLIEGIKQQADCAADMEITLEANPGTFEQEKFAAYRQLGINRLSIGIQSFNQQQLHNLGRAHDASEALQAAKIAQQAGFANFNLDLMHGLPNQDKQQALADLHQAIELNPSHISWYQLTIEPNTVFWSQPPQLPKEEQLWDIQQAGQQLLAKHDFIQYEISAYARAGKQCRHNLNYWQFGDYLAIGAGAHGKISHSNGQILRYSKARQPEHYLRNQERCGVQALDNSQLPFEFMLNALRLCAGVNSQLFCQRTGLSLESLQPGWQEARQRGLMLDDEQRLVTSERGALFLNDVLHLFLT